jgi:hypothetical protein
MRFSVSRLKIKAARLTAGITRLGNSVANLKIWIPRQADGIARLRFICARLVDKIPRQSLPTTSMADAGKRLDFLV